MFTQLFCSMPVRMGHRADPAWRSMPRASNVRSLCATASISHACARWRGLQRARQCSSSMICRQPRSMIGNACAAQPFHAFVDVRRRTKRGSFVPQYGACVIVSRQYEFCSVWTNVGIQQRRWIATQSEFGVVEVGVPYASGV